METLEASWKKRRKYYSAMKTYEMFTQNIMKSVNNNDIEKSSERGKQNEADKIKYQVLFV